MFQRNECTIEERMKTCLLNHPCSHLPERPCLYPAHEYSNLVGSGQTSYLVGEVQGGVQKRKECLKLNWIDLRLYVEADQTFVAIRAECAVSICTIRVRS